MMQLAQELKTLARDLGVAVVVRKWAWPTVLILTSDPRASPREEGNTISSYSSLFSLNGSF